MQTKTNTKKPETVDQLKARAKARGLKGYSKLSRPQLVALHAAADAREALAEKRRSAQRARRAHATTQKKVARAKRRAAKAARKATRRSTSRAGGTGR